jgi:ADP-heptose:LPS heptosyltransferase
VRRWAGIARLGSIGDNLIAASVLHPLKRMGYNVEVICCAPSNVVYLHNPKIDKLTVKDPKDLPQGDMGAWQRWFDGRAKEYDLFLHASHSCEARHALFKTQTEFWLPQDYRRSRCKGSYLETVHDMMGVPHEFGPLYYTSSEEREHAYLTKRQIGERCIGWVIAGSRIDKIFPNSTYAVERIVREVGPVALIGGVTEKERSMAEAIRDHVQAMQGHRKHLHIVVPDKPLRSTLAFLHQCDLVVSPDTGPAWAVAMEPMPKVIMVSHASAENITKHWVNTTTLHADPARVPCWPCHRLHEEPSTCVVNKEGNGAACISDITVDRLVSAVAEAWNGSNVVQLRTPAHVQVA